MVLFSTYSFDNVQLSSYRPTWFYSAPTPLTMYSYLVTLGLRSALREGGRIAFCSTTEKRADWIQALQSFDSGER